MKGKTTTSQVAAPTSSLPSPEKQDCGLTQPYRDLSDISPTCSEKFPMMETVWGEHRICSHTELPRALETTSSSLTSIACFEPHYFMYHSDTEKNNSLSLQQHLLISPGEVPSLTTLQGTFLPVRPEGACLLHNS